jgi:tetratricopeptide (TPR) repeat protein
MLAPSDDAVILGWAAALIASGDASGAISLLEGRLAAKPGWAEGHGRLAKLLWMAGEGERATSSLTRALELKPGDLLLWREYLGILTHAARWDEALATIEAGRAAAGEHLMFVAQQAACLDEAGRPDEASSAYARMMPIRDPMIAVHYTRHLLRLGRPDEASRFAHAWLGGPAAGAFWPYLSIAWRLAGDPRWQWLEGDPRLVGVYDIRDAIGPIDALARCLRDLHVLGNQPLEQSVRGGTQTDGHLLARIEPEIRSLRAAIVAAVERHIAQLPPPDPAHPTLSIRRDRPVRFSGSWSVRLSGGGHHANHLHPGGWLSSALYIAMPDEDERGAPPAGWLWLGQPQNELGLGLEPFRQVEPKPGRLVLFPSTMWHGTVPFDAGERLTVAFDVAPPV